MGTAYKRLRKKLYAGSNPASPAIDFDCFWGSRQIGKATGLKILLQSTTSLPHSLCLDGAYGINLQAPPSGIWWFESTLPRHPYQEPIQGASPL